MTLLLTWIGADSKKNKTKPASIYFASDSRISWGNGNHFDHGQKVFACKKHPDIFGYCGDVLFPSLVLSQIVNLIDSSLLFNETTSVENKAAAIQDKLVSLLKEYPHQTKAIINSNISVLYATRDRDGNFYLFKSLWNLNKNEWLFENIKIPSISDKLIVLGSGKDDFNEKYKIHDSSPNKKTSRAIFQAFCDTLENTKVPSCGGAPQLVGLYRKFNAKQFGIIYKNQRYFYGLPIEKLDNYNKIEWRNNLFERCDGETMDRKDNAQKQPNIIKYKSKYKSTFKDSNLD